MLDLQETEWKDLAVDDDMVGKNPVKVATGKKKGYICPQATGRVWDELWGTGHACCLKFVKGDEIYDLIAVLGNKFGKLGGGSTCESRGAGQARGTRSSGDVRFCKVSKIPNPLEFKSATATGTRFDASFQRTRPALRFAQFRNKGARQSQISDNSQRMVFPVCLSTRYVIDSD